MMLFLMRTFLCLLLTSECYSHVTITYPPARKYAMDFMDVVFTPPPCGMSKGLGPVTDLRATDWIDVTWHLAYPHKGGYQLTLLDANEMEIHSFTEGFVGTDNPTELHRLIQLPDITCMNCSLRLVREAGEWTSSCGSRRKYDFYSCADVNIVQYNIDPCSGFGHISVITGKCICGQDRVGPACQYKEECFDDNDCLNGGWCAKDVSTYYPKSQCYCAAGWFGRACEKNSSVTSLTMDMDDYTATPVADGFKIYHRILQADGEIEVVLQAKTDSWVGVGWRPSNYRSGCRLFPVIPTFPNTAIVPSGEGEGEPEDEELVEPESGSGEAEGENGSGDAEGETGSGKAEGETGSGEDKVETGSGEDKGETESGETEGETGSGEAEGETGSGTAEGETGSGDAEGENGSGEAEGEGETESGETNGETGSGEAEGETGSETAEGENGSGTAEGETGSGEVEVESESEDEELVEPESGSGEAEGENGSGDAEGETGSGKAEGETGSGEDKVETGSGEDKGETESGETEGETGSGEAEGETGSGTAEGETGSGDAEGENGSGEAEGEGETESGETNGETGSGEAEGETGSETAEGENGSGTAEGETGSGKVEVESESEAEDEKSKPTDSELSGSAENETEPEGEGEGETEPEGEGGGTCGGLPAGTSPTTGGTLHPMDCIDLVIGSAKGGFSRIGDYYTRDRSTPQLDSFYGGDDSLTAAIGEENGGFTTILFRRKLESSSADGSDHSIIKDAMHVIWARGQIEENAKHRPPSGLDDAALNPSDPQYYRNDELKYHGRNPVGSTYGHRGFFTMEFYGPPPVQAIGCDGSWTAPSGNYAAKWTFDIRTNKITFTLSAKLSPQEYMAIGINPLFGMVGPNSDAYVAWMDGTVPIVSDRHLRSKDKGAELDRNQDANVISGIVENGFTTIVFTRDLDTGDENDFNFDGTNCAHFLFSWAGTITADGGLAQHNNERTVSTTKYCFTQCDVEGGNVTIRRAVGFTFKLKLQYDESLDDTHSREYKELEKDVKETIQLVFGQVVGGLLNIFVQRFRQGSVLVDCFVTIERSGETIEDIENAMKRDVETALEALIEGGQVNGFLVDTNYKKVRNPEPVRSSPGSPDLGDEQVELIGTLGRVTIAVSATGACFLIILIIGTICKKRFQNEETYRSYSAKQAYAIQKEQKVQFTGNGGQTFYLQKNGSACDQGQASSSVSPPPSYNNAVYNKSAPGTYVEPSTILHSIDYEQQSDVKGNQSYMVHEPNIVHVELKMDAGGYYHTGQHNQTGLYRQ